MLSVTAALVVGGFFVATPSAFADSALITQINFTNDVRTVTTNTASAVLTTQTRNMTNTSEDVTTTTHLTLSSDSITGQFSSSASDWIPTTDLTMGINSANRNFYYKNSTPGTYTLTVTASVDGALTGWTVATQTITVVYPAVASVSNPTELNAALSNTSITTINFLNDITTTAQITVNKSLTIDGNGSTLFAPFAKTDNDNNAAIGVIGVNGVVVIKNLTINGSGSTGSRHGINTSESSNVTLSNVTIMNNNAAGLIVNSSNVTADNLNTSGNAWYGVNVDKNDTSNAVFTLTGNGVIAEATQIISDKTIGATVGAGGYDVYTIGSTTKTIWTNKALTNVATITVAPTVLYTSIQAAINVAQDGNTIKVAAGTYIEQLTINKDLTIIGAGDTTIIQSPDVLTSTFIKSGNPMKPVITIKDGATANISALKVDGAAKGNNTTNTFFVGIGLYNAGGTLDHVTVTGIKETTPNRDQQGEAILAINTDGSARTLNITNSTISDFQKNGITLSGSGLTVTVSGNHVTGTGANNLVAQNGIHIGTGVTGSVTGNTVGEVRCDDSTCGNDWYHDYQAMAIVVAGAVGPITISGNIVSNSDVGIYSELSSASGVATITNNILTGNRWFGMLFEKGAVTVTGGSVTGGGSNAIGIFNPSEHNTGTTTVHNVNISGNSIAGLKNDAASFNVDAIHNWWGSAVLTDVAAKISNNSNVFFTPYYITDELGTLSDIKTIAAFTIPSQTGSTINQSTLAITINMPFGTNVTALIPTIITNTGASVSPASGVPQNFTSPVLYTVRSVDEKTYGPYTVTVTVAPVTYTVTFDANGSTGGTIPSDQTKTYDVNLVLATNSGTLVKTGYTFSGWNTLANGTGTGYATGANYTDNTGVTLFAQWTAIEYTITFDSAGGSVVAPIVQNYGTAVTAPTAPTKAGYTFSAWSPAFPATMPLGGAALTATWTANNNGGGGGGGGYYQPATPAVPANVATPDGCAAGNKFSTTTGRNCNAATPAVPAGQVLGASTQAGQVLGAEKFHFTLFIKNGSNGNEIIELQKFLTALGYNLGTADGKFGPKTKAAVIKFQIANKLKGDGVVGALTRAFLNK